jgi:hypothetical protein
VHGTDNQDGRVGGTTDLDTNHGPEPACRVEVVVGLNHSCDPAVEPDARASATGHRLGMRHQLKQDETHDEGLVERGTLNLLMGW